MQNTTTQISSTPDSKRTPMEIPAIATEPHPRGSIGIPGLDVLPELDPNDQQGGATNGKDDADESAADSGSKKKS